MSNPVSAPGVTSTLFGIIGVALGYLTRSTVAAVVGAVGWVLFGELAVLRTLAPHLAKWLVTESATALTDPATPGSQSLTPVVAVAVLGAYAIGVLIVAAQAVLRRDVA